jgi:hypothetical protein
LKFPPLREAEVAEFKYVIAMLRRKVSLFIGQVEF